MNEYYIISDRFLISFFLLLLKEIDYLRLQLQSPKFRILKQLKSHFYLLIKHIVCLLPGQLSPAFNSEKNETRRNLEIPRLSETSIKDRMAKYQAAVSKQSSFTNYTVCVLHLSFTCSSCKWSLSTGTRNVFPTLTCETWLLPLSPAIVFSQKSYPSFIHNPSMF